MRRMEQYFPVRWTKSIPDNQVPSFARKYEIKRKALLPLFTCFGVFDDSEAEINDVLGKGDNITFIVRIYKESATTFTVPLYFPDEFKSHFRMTSKLFIRAVMLTFHVR